MRTSQLLILTSSCAVVIMPVATRCRLPTIHVNIGCNKLLSQSAETITDEIKRGKTDTREEERETRGELRPAFINTEKIQFPSWTHITLCYTPAARLPERKPRPQNKREAATSRQAC